MIKDCPQNERTTVITDDVLKSGWISLTMNSQLVHTLVDTRSSISQINKELAERLENTVSISCEIYEKIRVTFTIGIQNEQELYSCKNSKYPLLLGLDFLVKSANIDLKSNRLRSTAM